MQPLLSSLSSSLSSPLLACSRLSLRRGQRQILDGLDFNLECGTLTALLGPNGAGKSSLLKCLTGELEYEGSITLFGENRQQWSGKQLAHRLGVLPQSSSLNFPFLCEEVVAMGRLPHSEPATRRDEIVAAAMTHAGVEHLAKRLYPGLSGGERQRVQFARVLAQIWQAPSPAEQAEQPRLLLLDEPTAALDLKYQHQLLTMARALASRNTAVLVVLHDLNLAARYADRLVMLERGKLMADGTPGEVLTPELIARLYDYPAQVIHHPESGLPMVV
jgi:iron complex transport system ATP-binding protein